MAEELSDEMYKNSKLGPHYVFNYMFKKLGDTFERYREIIPPIEDVEQEICRLDNTDEIEAILGVITVLKSRSEDSVLIAEIFKNIKRDFKHGMEPTKYKQHTGKYYLDSVAD